MTPEINVVEEQGFFWWSDEPVPDQQFGPKSAVSGNLLIDEKGRITLELNGVLPHPDGPFVVLTEVGKPLPRDKGICGKLKKSGRSVLLLELRRNGGHLGGIAFEKYFALHALIGSGTLQPKDHPLGFGRLRVELKGFEEWLALRSIETKRTRASIRVRHRLPKKISYPMSDGRLSIGYDIAGPYLGTSHSPSLQLNELGFIEYAFNAVQTLDEMKTLYRLFCDLLILLTGSDYSLDWPVLTRGKRKGSPWQFFFLRGSSKAESPKLHECWTNFPELKERLGTIFSTLREKREKLGPGMYLYLGTRRAEQIYEEHRFVNLIWGIESLHRRKGGTTEAPSRLKAKIKRIMDQVARPTDKKWLEHQLLHAGEPALSQRIFETLKALPLGLEESRLRTFSEACADRRNEISHFGGERPAESAPDYQAFILDLSRKSEALQYLYHAWLLQEIGIDTEVLRRHVYRGFRSHATKFAFVEAGLLPESVLPQSTGVGPFPPTSTTAKPS